MYVSNCVQVSFLCPYNTCTSFRLPMHTRTCIHSHTHSHPHTPLSLTPTYTHPHTAIHTPTHTQTLTHTHPHSPGVHAQYVGVLVANVLEYLQHSLGTQKDLLFLIVIVHLVPLGRQLQTVPTILGLVPAAPTGGLEGEKRRKMISFHFGGRGIFPPNHKFHPPPLLC